VRATSGVKSRWWLSRIGLKGSAHLVERSACAFAQCNIVFSRLARRGGRSSPLVAKPLLPAQNRLGRLLSPPGQARQRVHKRSRRCVVQVQYGQYVHKSAYEEGQLDHEIGCMMSQSSSVARVAVVAAQLRPGEKQGASHGTLALPLERYRSGVTWVSASASD
jgi:hypothetical protein